MTDAEIAASPEAAPPIVEVTYRISTRDRGLDLWPVLAAALAADGREPSGSSWAYSTEMPDGLLTRWLEVDAR